MILELDLIIIWYILHLESTFKRSSFTLKPVKEVVSPVLAATDEGTLDLVDN